MRRAILLIWNGNKSGRMWIGKVEKGGPSKVKTGKTPQLPQGKIPSINSSQHYQSSWPCFACESSSGSWQQHSNLAQIQHAINLVPVLVVPVPRRTTAAVVVKWPNVEDVRILDVISLVPAHVHLVKRWDTVVARAKRRIGRITRKNVQDTCARWARLTLKKQ